MIHKPVLQKEVLKYLDPKHDENFIDATIGGGGHSFAILERNGPRGKVLGIDFDPEQIKNVEHRKLNKERLILVCDNFANLKEIVEKHKFGSVQGILFDLGMSSWHLEKSGRGFTFQKDEPLDMRFNRVGKGTAEKIVNTWPELEIEKVLREYGQEKFARRIAKGIVEARKAKPIKTTFQLVEIVKKATPAWYHHKKIPRSRTHSARSLRGRHPATRTFQALRIAVNDELNNLKKALPQALKLLKDDGRLVVISFHSLEDGICKNFLRENVQKGLIKILTKKPITPLEREIKLNPRSRSAKLRAGIKVSKKQ